MAENEFPKHSSRDDSDAETIDLQKILTHGVTVSGSFEMSRYVSASTVCELADALPIPAILIDQDSVVVGVNQACGRISPDYEKIVGCPFEQLFAEQAAARKAQSLLEEVFLHRKPQIGEATLHIGEGKIWGRMTLRSLRILENRFVVVLVEDLTPEKKQLILNKRINDQLHQEIERRGQVERELADSEKKYRQVVETANDIIYLTDHHGCFTFVNPVGLRITGYALEEIIGKHYLDLIPPDHREDAKRFYRVQFEKRLPATYYDFPILTRQGETVWLGQNAQILTEGDRITGFQVIARDITDRKRAEQALRESEKRYRDLFEYASDLIYTHDIHGNYTWVNEAAARTLGYSREEILKLNYKDIVESAYVPLTTENLRKKVENGLESTGPYEIPIRAKDGRRLWLEITSRIIKRDGKPIGVHGMARDVTDRRVAQEALSESERFLSSVFACIQDGLSILDKDMRIIRVNPTVKRWYPHGEPFIGRKCHEAYHGLPHPCDACPSLTTLKTGQSSYGVVPKRGATGEVTGWLDLYSFPLIGESPGELKGVIQYIRDITEQKRLEEQLRQAAKMEAIGTLAGGLAHDFNNLLQIVLGYADLLLLGKVKEGQDYQRAAAIRAAAKRGSDLVRRILTFSRRVETKLQPISMNSELGQIKDLLRSSIPKMIDIKLHLADDLHTINADPTQIEQIVLNLAVNATHAMPEGGKLILETRNVQLDEEYCRSRLETKPGPYVLLMVSDTGHGMDEDILDRIFEPFFTTKKPGEGTGLGLSIVFGIVKSHGGHITCHSRPGMGTSFRIYFPAVETRIEFDPETTLPMPAFGTETLLLVDDEESIRNLGQELLGEVGYRVITAGTGQEALRIYRESKEQISLVILDLIMPDMGGTQCLEGLLAINPEVKVLIASGCSSDAPAQEVVNSGAKGFVGKPYNFKQILRAVRHALDAD